MKNLFLFLSVCLSYNAISQTLSPESLFPSTGNTKNNYAQISWTIGDIQTTTYKNDNLNLVITQGFLQSDITSVNVINVAETKDIDIKVYPNPTKDFVHIMVSSNQSKKVDFHLYNFEGKEVYRLVVNSKEEAKIDFRQFQSGVYLLKAISDDKLYLKTHKIFYQD